MTIKKNLFYFEPFFTFIPLLVICFIGLFSMLSFPDFLNENTTSVTQRTLLSSIISVSFAILLIYVGYVTNKRLHYFFAVRAILREMRVNHDQMKNFPKKFQEAYSTCEKIQLIRWIEKKASLTNWGDGDNFHLKYLSSQAYFDFINKGYINQTYFFFKFPSSSIAHFYQFGMEFSKGLQELENGLRSLELNRKTPPIIIDLKRFPDKKEFHTSHEICTFLTGRFYPFYAQKNDFNDGLLKEYEETIKSLEDHTWLICEEKKMRFDWQNLKEDGWNLGLVWRGILGIVALIVGFWILSTFRIFSADPNNLAAANLYLAVSILLITMGFSIWAGIPTEKTLNKILLKLPKKEKRE